MASNDPPNQSVPGGDSPSALHGSKFCNGELEVLYHCLLDGRSSAGVALFWDPVFVELLFVTRWRNIRLRLTPSKYATLSSFGPLPVGMALRRCSGDNANGSGSASTILGKSFGPDASTSSSGGVVPRSQLLSAVAALDRGGSDVSRDLNDRAFCSLLRCRLGDAIEAFLWCDDEIWNDFTRPALIASAPFGFGWLAALTQRRCQLSNSAWSKQEHSMACTTALSNASVALEALADRLGEAESFGARSTQASTSEDLTALDACAFGHLAVLFSIPCEVASSLHDLISRYPKLIQFCDRMQVRLNAWPDTRSFLVAVPPNQRLPGAAMTVDSPTTPALLGTVASRKETPWWEELGWSWSGPRQRPKPKARRRAPPLVYPFAFCVLAVTSATSVMVVRSGGCRQFANACVVALRSSGAALLDRARKSP
eukprot:TRINITY_DN10858_c0_g2_i1.p1 TRINITY_DN10858_c0_g2~~TRINITY_DN10858_c0_g2_i1.p1  ORF type:complete len:426 (-),score=56.53 TRINITY_DN10858_c0_g2_i1:103-1380(-)